MSEVLEDEADRAECAPHPRHATALFGHVDPERELLAAFKADRLPHAIILGGPTSVGKATLAWRLARFVLANPDPRLEAVQAANDLTTSQAPSAAQVASLAHPDLFLLRREMNEKTKRFFTEIRADDVRRAISLFQRAPGAGGYRICIVDSAEDLNRSSANALLKLIEEPPPRSLFLMIAHRPGLVMPTIRSRARLIRLGPLRDTEVGEVLASLGTPWTEGSNREIAAAIAGADGSVQTAMRRLQQESGDIADLVAGLLARLPRLDWRDVHKLADRVAGRDGETAFESAVGAIFDWLSASVRSRPEASPRQLAPLAVVWEKVAASVRETEALNLDKRPLILSIFSDLAAVVRSSAA